MIARLLTLILIFTSAAHAQTVQSTFKISAQANFALPQQVLDATRAAPLSFGENISGVKQYDNAIVRTKFLTIAKRSSFLFRLNPRVSPPPFLVLAAENVFIEGPQNDSDAAVISYELTTSPDGDFPGDAPDGADQPPDTGARGGNGGNGLGGNPPGRTYHLPPVYIMFPEYYGSRRKPEFVQRNLGEI